MSRNKIPVALMYLSMTIKTTFFLPKQMRFGNNGIYCSLQIKEKALINSKLESNFAAYYHHFPAARLQLIVGSSGRS